MFIGQILAVDPGTGVPVSWLVNQENVTDTLPLNAS